MTCDDVIFTFNPVHNFSTVGGEDGAFWYGSRGFLKGIIYVSTPKSFRKATLSGFVDTDGARAYQALKRDPPSTVKHSVKEYVDGETHINSMESFWSLLKRGYYGTYHKMSPEHLQRYVDEFFGRHNIWGLATIEQMEETAKRAS